MKKILYILLISLLFTSCSLVDVMDELPPHAMVPENVINDEKSAESLLIGIYSEFRNRGYNDALVWAPASAAGFLKEGVRENMSFVGEHSFMGNEIGPETTQSGHLWTSWSKTVNYVNYFEKALATVGDDIVNETSRKKFLGEARFIRAHANLYLLTYFGYFWDINSEYGIVLRKEPSTTNNLSQARSTVRETYDFIISDLEYASQHAPAFDKDINYRGSSLAAKALLARVLLYVKEYDRAIEYAQEVIKNQDGVVLEENYKDVFSKNLASSEHIFARKLDAEAIRFDNQKWSFQNAGLVLSDLAESLLKDDPRYSTIADSANMNDPYTKEMKYFGQKVMKAWNAKDDFGTVFIRLSEMYLILAECYVESNKLDEAVKNLNVLRARAGAAAIQTLGSKESALDAVLQETFAELSFEIGHEWYTMVRMGKVADFKVGIEDFNRWVCAIPSSESKYNILALQNPYYIR